jgi:nitroreductase
MTTLEAITTRTSYRGTYNPTPVPKADLSKILEAGLAAPSGCNKQTTSLIAIDDPSLLSKLHDVIHPKAGETAPAMICILTQKTIAYRDRSFYIQDYAAAIENMLLAIVALGYQSCWYEGHITDLDAIGRKMADILEVPKDYELVCFLPIGIAEEPLTHRPKKPFQERAWFNGFKKGTP